MKKFIKCLSVLMVIVTVLSVVSISSASVFAATTMNESDFNTLLQKFKADEYPNGSTYKNNNYSTLGYECFGYANYLAKYIFGSFPTSDMSAVNKKSGWTITYGGTAVDNLHIGDIVRYKYHSIFITNIDGNDVYYTEANYDYANSVRWNVKTTKATLKGLVAQNLTSGPSSIDGKQYTGWVAHYNNWSDTNILTINYNVNGGTILSDILSYDYEVTEEKGINMRETAGTGGTKLTALPKGTTFTVKYGETATADGYTWGKTTYNGYTGWVVISDYVEQTGVSRTTDFYVESSLVYRSSTSSLIDDPNEYGVYNEYGLYNATTFGLVREGYDFVGWSLTPTGEEIIDQDMGFKPEEIVPELENGSLTVTFYAIWQRNTKVNVMFTYDENGGTGIMSETNGVEGEKVTLSANAYVNEGYDFAGWQIQRSDGKWYVEEYGWYSIDLIDERGYTITTYADGAEIYLDSDFVTLDYDFTCTLHAVWVAKPEPIPTFEIKSISHEVSNDKVIFTVVTTPDFNRVKVTNADNLASYIAYSSNYVVNSDGDYVFTLSVPAVEGVSQYAFDGRRVDTNKYAKAYAYTEIEVEETTPTIITATHEISKGKIIFTVVTKSGAFSRIKVTTSDNLSGSLGVANTYTVNAEGNYVWTIKANEPSENTTYAFDLRNAETSKYLKEYFYYEAEAATPTILSATYAVSDGKIVFTVVTKSGAFSRIKVTTSDNLGGSLGVANTYTVNSEGNYVWTVKANEPSENTTYAFDLRNADTSKYLKEYFYCEVEAATPAILSASHTISGEKIIFTVVTKAGNYDRIKATLANNLGGSIAVGTTYSVDENGNYVWTIKAPVSEAASYAFDLRVAGGRYQKEYLYYNV